MSEDLSLPNKYRPSEWKHVIGQPAIVRSFKASLENRTNHTYLLSGPSGCGKTTLARIAAKEVGCLTSDIREVDAAKFTGVDDMRQITDVLRYKPFTSSISLAVIVNEVHRLSGNAFDALLMSLEEPPSWVWWFLTTTNPGKVPIAVQTRCTRYQLAPVGRQELRELLEDVAKAEKLELGRDEADHDAIIDICVKEASGSPRTALVNLGACIAAKDKNEARSLLKQVAEGGKAFELAKALVGNPSWQTIKEILESLKEENPEGVRHVVQDYMTKVILNSNGKGVEKHLAVLEAFAQPFQSGDGLAPLVLACGTLVLCLSQ